VASLQKTYSGDTGSWIAGMIWGEIKRRNNEKDIDEREGDPVVKEAAKELIRENEEDRQSIPIRDEKLRDQVSKLFGAGLDVKIIHLDDKVDTLSSNVSVLGAGLVDTNKLIINHNKILEDKFDKLLDVLGVGVKAEKKAEEDAKADGEASEIGLQFGDFGSTPLIPTKLKKGRGNRGLINFLMRRYGAVLGNRIFKAIVRRTVAKGVRSRVRLMKAVPGKVRRKAAQMMFKQTVGRVIGREATERVLKKGVTKAVGKKVPGFGWVAGSIFAIERLMKGDYEGAGLEMLSGIAGSIPTVGTAASLGIDAYIIQRDIEKELRGSYAAGTGRTKKGLAELHGREVILGHKEQSEIALGFRNAIDQIGSVLASTSMEIAGAVGAEGLVREQMQKDGLNFDIVDIPFKSELGRVRTENLDVVAQNQLIAWENPFGRVKTVDEIADQELAKREEKYLEERDNLPIWNLKRHENPNFKGLTSGGGPGLYINAQDNTGIIDKTGEPGVDFTPAGTNNRAVFDGEVVGLEYHYDKSSGRGYGHSVRIRSEDPSQPGQYFDGLYGHFPKNAIYVRKGQKISVGQKLGRMGTLKDRREDVGSIEGPHTSLDFFNVGTMEPYPLWKTNILPYVDTKFSTAGLKEFSQQLIKVHEAEKLKVNELGDHIVHDDGEGNPTIGYGHLIDKDSPYYYLLSLPKENQWITEEQAQALFQQDWLEHLEYAKNTPAWNNATMQQKAALIDMAYNFGDLNVYWPKMLKALENGDIDKVLANLKWDDPNSKDRKLTPYFLKSGRRFQTIEDLMKNEGIDPTRTNEYLPENIEILNDILNQVDLSSSNVKQQLISLLESDSKDTEEFENSIDNSGSPIVILNNQITASTPPPIIITKSGVIPSWKSNIHLALLDR